MSHHLQYAHTWHDNLQLLACQHCCLPDWKHRMCVMLIPFAYSPGVDFQVTHAAYQLILASHEI